MLTRRIRAIVRVVLVFWNETRGDWDTSGVFRDNDAILASGDNCTLIGYATHFTTFTLGSIAIQLNAIDPNAVSDVSVRLFSFPLSLRRGAGMSVCARADR
jgi:hypothetical protein